MITSQKLKSDIFILPIEEGKEEDSVDELMRKLEPSYSEQPPDWICNTPIKQIGELNEKIRGKEEEITKLVNEKKSLQKQKN